MTVDNTPKILVRDLTDHTHALTIKDPNNPAQMVILPLALQGVTLLLNVRVLTFDKWDCDTFWWLHLTSECLTWDLTLTLYEEQEAAMADYSSHVVMKTGAARGYISNLVTNTLSSLTTDLADVTDDDNF
jgi:hypothetical protein